MVEEPRKGGEMSLDMYGEKVAEASALIREFAKVDYFHYFARDPESSLEEFIAMLEQAEEKGRQSQATRIAELERQLNVAHLSASRTSADLRNQLAIARQERSAFDAKAQDRIAELERQLSVALKTPVNDWCPECHARDCAPQQVSDLSAAILAMNCPDTTHYGASKAVGYEQAWDECRRAAAALAASQNKAGVQWQPIETAPKDGTRILVWLGAPWSNAQAVRWFESWQNWQTEDFPDEYDEYCGIGSELPTHWMPLPHPPTTEGERQ